MQALLKLLKNGRQNIRNTAWWLDDNKEVLLLASPFLIKAGKAAYRKTRKTKAEQERYRIDHTYYDRHLDLHYTLKRPMTNEDLAIFEMRRRNDEPTHQILKDLGLI
jgi:hypothetical protein